MDIGKVPNSVLNEIVINKIKANRKEILVGPKIGEDCERWISERMFVY